MGSAAIPLGQPRWWEEPRPVGQPGERRAVLLEGRSLPERCLARRTSGTLQVGGGGQSIVPTGQTGTVKPSGSGGLVSGNGTANGTNSTGNDTGMGHRIDIAGLHGLRGVLLGVIGAISLGVLGGGWVLM